MKVFAAVGYKKTYVSEIAKEAGIFTTGKNPKVLFIVLWDFFLHFLLNGFKLEALYNNIICKLNQQALFALFVLYLSY